MHIRIFKSSNLKSTVYTASEILTYFCRGGGELLRKLHNLAEAESKLSYHQKCLADIDAQVLLSFCVYLHTHCKATVNE